MKVYFCLILIGLAFESTLQSHAPKFIKYSYTLWVNDDVSEKVSLNLKSPNGTVFEQAMDKAAGINPDFEYEFQDFGSLGKFITKIGEFSNDAPNNKFWMIYELPNKPDEANKPGDEFLTPVGVSSLLVQDDKHYLFWLKTISME